jgi:hypothetical protein
MTRLASLQTMKDLLLYGPGEASLDEDLNNQWTQSIAEMSRVHDYFAGVVLLTASPEKSVYTVPDNTTKIYSVAYNKKTLGYTDRENLDLSNPDWAAAESDSPDIWSHNALPGEIGDGLQIFTPRDFLIYPPPGGEENLVNAISLIYGLTPSEIPLWMEPLLMYSCMASLAQDNPSLMEPEKAAWFGQLADLWTEVATKRLNV